VSSEDSLLDSLEDAEDDWLSEDDSLSDSLSDGEPEVDSVADAESDADVEVEKDGDDDCDTDDDALREALADGDVLCEIDDDALVEAEVESPLPVTGPLNSFRRGGRIRPDSIALDGSASIQASAADNARFHSITSASCPVVYVVRLSWPR
jgi:hypothetical protein